jgi:hypothetical protein
MVGAAGDKTGWHMFSVPTVKEEKITHEEVRMHPKGCGQVPGLRLQQPEGVHTELWHPPCACQRLV